MINFLRNRYRSLLGYFHISRTGRRMGHGWGQGWAGKQVIAGQANGSLLGSKQVMVGQASRSWLGRQAGHGWAGKQVMVGQAHGSWLGRHMGHGWASMLNLLTLSRYYSQR